MKCVWSKLKMPSHPMVSPCLTSSVVALCQARQVAETVSTGGSGSMDHYGPKSYGSQPPDLVIEGY